MLVLRNITLLFSPPGVAVLLRFLSQDPGKLFSDLGPTSDSLVIIISVQNPVVFFESFNGRIKESIYVVRVTIILSRELPSSNFLKSL
jgi:hypothetical protein